MTNKEYILDCLINDDEAFTQIKEFFLFVNVTISDNEIKKLLSDMVDEGMILINKGWVNENMEYPYSLTQKGKEAWENIQ